MKTAAFAAAMVIAATMGYGLVNSPAVFAQATPPATNADKEVANPADNRGPLESPAATGRTTGGVPAPIAKPAKPSAPTTADKSVANPAGNRGPVESPAATGRTTGGVAAPMAPPRTSPSTEPAQSEVAKPTPQK
jgi:hypothetical protein